MTSILLSAVPASAVALWFNVELPRKYRRKVLKYAPPWVSSTLCATLIGYACQGVLGSYTGFVSEIILYPTFKLAEHSLKQGRRRNLTDRIGLFVKDCIARGERIKQERTS